MAERGRDCFRRSASDRWSRRDGSSKRQLWGPGRLSSVTIQFAEGRVHRTLISACFWRGLPAR